MSSTEHTLLTAMLLSVWASRMITGNAWAEKTSSSRRQHPTMRFVPSYVQPISLSSWNRDFYFGTEARCLHCRDVRVVTRLMRHWTMLSFAFAENQGILFDVQASSYIRPRAWRSVWRRQERGQFFAFQGGSLVDCLELSDSKGQVAKPKSS